MNLFLKLTAHKSKCEQRCFKDGFIAYNPLHLQLKSRGFKKKSQNKQKNQQTKKHHQTPQPRKTLITISGIAGRSAFFMKMSSGEFFLGNSFSNKQRDISWIRQKSHRDLYLKINPFSSASINFFCSLDIPSRRPYPYGIFHRAGLNDWQSRETTTFHRRSRQMGNTF